MQALSRSTLSRHEDTVPLIMAPALTELSPAAPHQLQDQSSKADFPDGSKTSGQHPPLYHELHSFEDFPDKIFGPTVWSADDYVRKPEQWIHHFADEEIEEMGEAADRFLTAGLSLTGITRVRTVIGLYYKKSSCSDLVGQLPASTLVPVLGIDPCRVVKWQRFYTIQRLPG